MIAELTNHIWQSTVFAAAAGLLTVGFRKNRAQVRYWLWLSASVKFLLPFSLLIGLGNRMEWIPAAPAVTARPAITHSMVKISEPFLETLPITPATRGSRDWGAIRIFGLWACGFTAIAMLRYRGWRRVRTAVRSSTPLDVLESMQIRSSPGLLEPGVVGLFRPVLLLPAGIGERLQPTQLTAVLAHELCHVRRRDNLTSAIHMIVEAMFWFHPLVWWIGARLVEERERACDEAVLSLGNEPHDYAEGILNVCKSYVESPLFLVSGVTGSNLKKRIQAILTGRIARDLTLAKKLALAAAGIAALSLPVFVGVIGAAAVPKFEEVSIKSCEAFSRSGPQDFSPGTYHSGCTSVQRLIQQAYGLFANGHMTPLRSPVVTGGPDWARSDLYEIDGRAQGPQTRATMNGPMLQALLEDRFKLTIHRETKEVPVYDLTAAAGGTELHPFQGTCIPWDFDHPNPGPQQCATSRRTNSGVELTAWAIPDLLYFFEVTLDRPVIDRTGITGRFDFHLDLDIGNRALTAPALSDPTVSEPDPSLVSTVKIAVKKLGLNLKPATGPGEFVVIDRVERPSGT